jgi:hypothetical protein
LEEYTKKKKKKKKKKKGNFSAKAWGLGEDCVGGGRGFVKEDVLIR